MRACIVSDMSSFFKGRSLTAGHDVFSRELFCLLDNFPANFAVYVDIPEPKHPHHLR